MSENRCFAAILDVIHCSILERALFNMHIVSYDQVADKIIEVRHQKIIVDSDVAELYGVETKDINKAVKNNPGKFPNGYILELFSHEKKELVENFLRFQRLKHSTVLP